MLNQVIAELEANGESLAAIAHWLLTLCGCRNNCLTKVNYRDMAAVASEEGGLSWDGDEVFDEVYMKLRRARRAMT